GGAARRGASGNRRGRGAAGRSRRTTKPGQPEREAVLELAARAVVVKAPRRRSADVPATSQAVWVVRATEIAPPPGCKPMEWIWLTTAVVDGFAAACRCVHDYALRWRGGRFHYTVKQG